MSQRDFAKAIGSTQSAVSHYLGGRAPPPLDDVRAWAVTLRLPTDVHDRFFLFAQLAHCPRDIEVEFLKQEHELAQLAARVTSLESRRAADAPDPPVR